MSLTDSIGRAAAHPSPRNAENGGTPQRFAPHVPQLNFAGQEEPEGLEGRVGETLTGPWATAAFIALCVLLGAAVGFAAAVMTGAGLPIMFGFMAMGMAIGLAISMMVLRFVDAMRDGQPQFREPQAEAADVSPRSREKVPNGDDLDNENLDSDEHDPDVRHVRGVLAGIKSTKQYILKLKDTGVDTSLFEKRRSDLLRFTENLLTALRNDLGEAHDPHGAQTCSIPIDSDIAELLKSVGLRGVFDSAVLVPFEGEDLEELVSDSDAEDEGGSGSTGKSQTVDEKKNGRDDENTVDSGIFGSAFMIKIEKKEEDDGKK